MCRLYMNSLCYRGRVPVMSTQEAGGGGAKGGHHAHHQVEMMMMMMMMMTPCSPSGARRQRPGDKTTLCDMSRVTCDVSWQGKWRRADCCHNQSEWKYTIQSSCAMCILHIVLSLTKISPICDVAPVHVFHVIHPRPDPSCITKLHSAIPTHGPSHNE